MLLFASPVASRLRPQDQAFGPVQFYSKDSSTAWPILRLHCSHCGSPWLKSILIRYIVSLLEHGFTMSPHPVMFGISDFCRSASKTLRAVNLGLPDSV